MKKFKILGMTIVGLVVTAMTTIQASPYHHKDSGFKIVIKSGVSTLGVNISPVFSINSRWSIELGINYLPLKFKKSETSTDGSSQGDVKGTIDYNMSLRFLSGSLIANYFPAGNGFMLNFGGIINGFRFSVIGTGTGKIGGTQIDNFGSTHGKITFNTLAPYLGLGYVFGSESWGGVIGLGVIYQGAAKVDLHPVFSSSIPLTQEEREKVLNDLASQRDDLANGLKKYASFYPVLNISFYFGV